MRNIWLVFILFITATVTNASTDPLVYAQPPLFYSTFTPKIAPCVYQEEGKQGACGWESWPDQIPVFYTTRTNPESVWHMYIKGDSEVVCIDHVCTDEYGTPRGYIDTDRDTSYWTVPVGYYLTELNGSISAVKYGNGPLQDTYPIKDVMVNDVSVNRVDGKLIALEETVNSYNVYCSEELQRCNYLGYQWTYTEISQLLPFVKTSYCDEFLCYLDTNRTKVAGINISLRQEYLLK